MHKTKLAIRQLLAHIKHTILYCQIAARVDGWMWRMAANSTDSQSAVCQLSSSQLDDAFTAVSRVWDDGVQGAVPVDRQEPRVSVKSLADGRWTSTTDQHLLRRHSSTDRYHCDEIEYIY